MRPATTLDAFLDGRLQLLQPRDGYRAGLDAVLLAATVAQAKSGMQLVDLGAGVGAVGLAVAMRLAGARVTLIERQAPLVTLAQENIELNRLGDRVRMIPADLEGPAAVLDAAGLPADSFDAALANPPFQVEGAGRAPPDATKAGAHVMAAGGIERWARASARLVRAGGTVAMIHRADALAEVLAAFHGRFGGLTVLPVHPRPTGEAVRVVVAGIKGSKAPLRLLPALVLHEPDGHGFTPRLRAILRQGAGLDLWASDAPALVQPAPFA